MDIVKLCNLIDTLEVPDYEKEYVKLMLVRSLEGELVYKNGYNYEIKDICLKKFDLAKALNITEFAHSDHVYLGKGDWGRKNESTSGHCPSSLFTTDTEEDVIRRLRKHNIFQKK